MRRKILGCAAVEDDGVDEGELRRFMKMKQESSETEWTSR